MTTDANGNPRDVVLVGDIIAFEASMRLSFAALTITDDGTDTTIDYGSGTILVTGRREQQFTETDFDFTGF